MNSWLRVCAATIVLTAAVAAAVAVAATDPDAPGSKAPRGGAAALPCPSGRRLPPARAGLLGRGAWSWFADPRAVNLGAPYDETAVGWIGWSGAITVGAVEPRCGIEQVAVVGHLFHDDHSAPAILVEPDRRLTVFWSAHNGRAMYYRTTLAPGDASAWTAAGTVASKLPGRLGFTYPNPVLLPAEANTLYLFWRGADYSADYATRTETGAWSPAHRMIVDPGQRPYLKVATDGAGTIALAYTNDHPRETTTSIYYAAYEGGWLRHADGRPIARLGSGPIAPRRGDLVYDGAKAHVSSWVWDVALDSRRRPVIVYATFPRVNDHAYWYARWNGRRWTSHFLTFAGPTISPGTIETEYSGGITLDHADPAVVFLSRKVHGRFQIEQWATPDGGSTWRHATVVPGRGGGAVRPVVPRGTGGPVTLVWLRGRYVSYAAYRNAVAYMR